MADLIDREILKKDLIKRWDRNDDHDFSNKEVWEALENAPSAKPPPETCWGCNCPKMEEPKKGRWIFTRYYVWECSECGKNPTKGMGYIQRRSELFEYCPKCGMAMDVTE